MPTDNRCIVPRPALLALAAGLVLSACGGGEELEPADPSTVAPTGVQLETLPLFHRQPVVLAEPGNDDVDGAARSVLADPQPVDVPSELRTLSTQGLTDERVQAWRDAVGTGRARALASGTAAAAPMPVVYTPAQIRAAYGLPTAPVTTAGLSTAAAAALGAGQTIYIVNAFHHPNALTDLNKFSERFGLPTCSAVAAPTSVKPLPAAAANACQVMVLYSSTGGSLTTVAPAYNAAWANEIALDMQWAHAIAPLARIVLIEATNSGNGLLDAIALANKLGPGVVSMSFGSAENSTSLNTTTLFTGAGMSYVAATGDSGSAANWPAVMPGVLAVSGTSLQVSGTGTRSETTWSYTGGGLSKVVPLPAYQAALSIPGQSSAATARRFRSVADVSFNADPNTGQYYAMTAPGRVTNWYAGGGTSISAPQWAGLLAVANAQRAQKALPPLGQLHTRLYGNFVPGSAAWAQNFNDVNVGSNGTCSGCKAIIGYDSPTGLGTPKALALLTALNAR
jgi:subtilase family serine protease